MKFKLLVSAILILLMGLALSFYNPFASDQAGEIRIQVIKGEEIVIDDVVAFYESDNLYEVLNRNYSIETSRAYSQAYGRHLLSIEDVVTDFENSFIHISKNHEHAHLGIDFLPLEDGSLYTFEVREPN